MHDTRGRRERMDVGVGLYYFIGSQREPMLNLKLSAGEAYEEGALYNIHYGQLRIYHNERMSNMFIFTGRTLYKVGIMFEMAFVSKDKRNL